ncbi:MAG: NADH-quinone oxidoreductase subunit A [Sulfobacillus sp.]
MLTLYLPIVIYFTISLLVCFGIMGASRVIGRPKRQQSVAKLQPYESGIVPEVQLGPKFSIKFYLVAMLFLIFDVEAVSFYPWAVLMRQLRLYGLAEMGLFILVLGIGYAYVWKRGGFQWDR